MDVVLAILRQAIVVLGIIGLVFDVLLYFVLRSRKIVFDGTVAAWKEHVVGLSPSLVVLAVAVAAFSTHSRLLLAFAYLLFIVVTVFQLAAFSSLYTNEQQLKESNRSRMKVR